MKIHTTPVQGTHFGGRQYVTCESLERLILEVQVAVAKTKGRKPTADTVLEEIRHRACKSWKSK